MRIVILYHPNSEFAGMCEDYAQEYHNRNQDEKIELISLETEAGAQLAQTYEVVRYPAMLVISGDGSLQRLWQDQPFPLIDEVAAYAHA
ncbi:MAG TPA: hypothetical protein VFP32_02745 [Candidatus Saccharimonadales bacterium]|nr:hypothetical protein [Candidatus Saccharimonadales bacterium]